MKITREAVQNLLKEAGYNVGYMAGYIYICNVLSDSARWFKLSSIEDNSILRQVCLAAARRLKWNSSEEARLKTRLFQAAWEILNPQLYGIGVERAEIMYDEKGNLGLRIQDESIWIQDDLDLTAAVAKLEQELLVVPASAPFYGIPTQVLQRYSHRLTPASNVVGQLANSVARC